MNPHTQTPSDYPVVFGHISLSGDLPVSEPLSHYTVLSAIPKNLEIYRSGNSSDIHHFTDGEESAVLYGRLYRPHQVNHFSTHFDGTIISPSGKDLRALSGSFTFFGIVHRQNKVRLTQNETLKEIIRYDLRRLTGR